MLFEYLRPPTIVVTTPNIEYNAVWQLGPRLRHEDHCFEWTRAQFTACAEARAADAGYQVRTDAIRPVSPELGAPTQLAVFTQAR